MRQGSGLIHLRTFTPAILALMVSGLSACESPHATIGDGITLNAKPEEQVGDVRPFDPQGRDRLSQAQRDVDQYLKQRQEKGSGLRWSDEPAEIAQSADQQNPNLRKRVIFNDGTSSDRMVARRNGRSRRGAGRVAESFEPAMLLRDPARPPDVNEFDRVEVNWEFPDGAEYPRADYPGAGVDLASDRLRQLMVDLRRELYIEGAHSDHPLKQLLPIAAMVMVDPDAKLNPDAVPDLTTTERELLGALQVFFQNLSRQLDDNVDVEEAIAQGIAELRDAITKEPQLQFPTLALCYKVDGFGKYKQFDHYRYLAHTEQQVIVYVEIEDFSSKLNENGEWVTQLAQQVTIYSDRDGIPVWRSGDMQVATDRSRKKRHDFFLLQIITIPKALSVGKYHLKVHVRDELSGAEAEDAIEFEMVADPKLAVRVP